MKKHLTEKEIEAIADYIIKRGTDYTHEGNYICSLDEIAEHFNVNKEVLIAVSNDIVNELYEHEEVADIQIEPDGAIDVCFYLAYCPNYIEKYDGELDDLNAGELKSMTMI